MAILVVCTANINRSPTAAWVIQLIEGSMNVWHRGSCQAACRIHGGTYCEQSDIDQADSIVCMEERNKNELIKAYGDGVSNKIRVLGIEDKYKKNDNKLVEEVLMKYNP